MIAPTVSVILPTFNRLKYLRPALESVFAQSFADWELIIADDGSDEETRAFLGALTSLRRVKVLWLSHTGRPAAVRNAALREAAGEYVAFLDSDDVWLPSKLEVQIRSLSRRGACKWAYAGFTLVDQAGDPRPRGDDERWLFPEGWIFEPLLKMQAIVAAPTVLACRAFVAGIGGFDESLRACEDYDLWLRLAARSEVDVIRESLVLVRRHADHYADDITALEGWRSVLEKTRGAGLDRRIDSIVQAELAKVSARLARSHAVAGSARGVLQTLLQSWRYSWRYRQWWFGAFEAATRVYAPAGMRRAVRRYRGRTGAQTGVKA
ncbi:MAG TPA: glycosyltransferase family 2 protein [Steroidobacter sp.]|jgi:hypothetical protein|nr:glycosyltransferase family 2 protein [Steroidobacter sp.]